ncbi:MAG: pilus assembly protein, partial [Asticcacaulis sp.]
SSDASCAFACHQMDKPSTGPNMDYYDLAKSIGVTTRIDVVRQATQNLMTTAANTETIAKQYRMAIYDFGKSADTIDPQNPGAYQISSLSPDLAASATNAAAIDLMTIPYQNYNSDRQSNMSTALLDMNKRIPSAGSGLSASTPQEVLFFVSDGTMDSYDCAYSNGSTCRRITPIDTTQCTAMKARGVRIAVLYTTYLPLPSNSFYNTYLAKYINAPSQVANAMENCASPGLYFEVSPSQGIPDAMNALFKKVVSTVRINS